MKGKAHIFCGKTIALDKNATRIIRVYDCFSAIDSKGQTREYRYFGFRPTMKAKALSICTIEAMRPS